MARRYSERLGALVGGHSKDGDWIPARQRAMEEEN